MVELNPLGCPGRAAGVDEQGQRRRIGCGGHGGAAETSGGKIRHIDEGGVVQLERRPFVDHDLRGGVAQLKLGLVGLQGGVDRRERGADLPGGEHDDDEFDAVGENSGHHVAGTDAVRGQHGGRSVDPLSELDVGQVEAVIVQAPTAGVLGGASDRKGCQMVDRWLDHPNL